jgi:hypothetical protein
MADLGAQTAVAVVLDTEIDPSPQTLEAMFVAWFGEPTSGVADGVSLVSVCPTTALQLEQDAWAAQVTYTCSVLAACGLRSEWLLREYQTTMTSLIHTARQVMRHAYEERRHGDGSNA